MSKKIFIICLIIFIIVAGIAVYEIFFRKHTASVSVSNQTTAGNYFPFGSGSGQQGSQNNQNSNGTSATNQVSGTISINDLTEITTGPVSGGIILSTQQGPTVRYAERAASHVYDVNLISGQITQISNTTVPATVESYWLNNGSTTILRYVDSSETIKTMSAALINSEEATSSGSIKAQLSVIPLPDNIDNMTVSPDRTKIFYFINNGSGAEGVVTNANGSSASQLFMSPVGDWLASWPAANTIALTTKPSSGVPGLLYFLSTKGTLTKVLSDIPGLTTLVNPSLTSIAYSDDQNNLYIYDIKNNTTEGPLLNTLAEKCVWSTMESNILYCAVPTNLSPGNYPDSWYQGLVSFSDDIYRINTLSGTASIVGSLTQKYSQNIDVIHPMLSSDESYLLFMNKKDSSLWTLRLPSATSSNQYVQ